MNPLSHRKKESQAQEHHDQEVESQPSQDPAADPEHDNIAVLLDRIEMLEKSLADAEADKLRALADFQNLRRRSQEERDTLRRFATENLVTALLPVLDNFERTISHLEAGADPAMMLAGIKMVEKQLRGVLESQNLRRIPSVGQPFDPDLHDAIGMEASEEFENDTVTTEIEPGYRIGDRVIRAARVKVAKNS
jgi:molecular chaperone GrpE